MATSTDVKRRYNEKTYKRWFVSLRNDVFEEIEAYREAEGLSRAEFLKMLVSEKYSK
jgi:hypothetical protein